MRLEKVNPVRSSREALNPVLAKTKLHSYKKQAVERSASNGVKSDLDTKFQKVLETPASFAFFVAIHDFIKHIESNPTLSASLSSRIKSNRELNIPSKYGYLKQIYQGLEDADSTSNADLGHTRYAVIIELKRIRDNDVSESNSFWKRRELSRRLTGEVYKILSQTVVA